MPDTIPPMLAGAGPLPSGDGWAFEFKYDGVRAVSYVDGGRVRVLSRNGNDVTATYPELGALGDLLADRPAILDGEIVALQTGDRPSFAKLASRMHVAQPTTALLRTVPVVYYVFDLLWLDGKLLLDEPYDRRRRLLAELALESPTVRTSPHFTGVDGAAILRAAELGGLEGVVAKRRNGPYRPGRRSTDSWTKVPFIRTQEVLILGWKPGEGRRAATIGSLLLGVLDESGAPRYAGNVGTGFTDVMLRQLHGQLTGIARGTPPVSGIPRDDARHAHWVEPVLVGEVAFRNWTPDGRMRHPSWRGLRPDRTPGEARRQPAPTVPAPATVEGTLATPDGRWRVQVIRRAGLRSYRLLHADNVVEGLELAAVEQLLRGAGVDLGDLIEINGKDDSTHHIGAA
jgi:bifunctional non-homologous end joining protein LigD